MLESIHHVQITIPSGREAEARAFYCELLGLVEIPKPPSLIHKGGFWIRLRDIQIHVSVQNGVDRYALNSHICFAVKDLKSWISKLQMVGLPTEANESIPEGRRVMLRDPFGNRLELLQPVDFHGPL